MKKGEIMLSAAAATATVTVTAAGAFGFRTHRTTGAKHIYGYINFGIVGQQQCKVSASCWTTHNNNAGGGGVVAICHTSGGVQTLTKGVIGELWTGKTPNGINCINQCINYTKTH